MLFDVLLDGLAIRRDIRRKLRSRAGALRAEGRGQDRHVPLRQEHARKLLNTVAEACRRQPRLEALQERELLGRVDGYHRSPGH